MPTEPSRDADELSNVAELSDALEDCSVSDAARALRALVSSHPDSWRSSIARLRALPDPARPDISTSAIAARCRTLAEATIEVESQGHIAAADARWLGSLAIETTRAAKTFAILREFLKSLSFFRDSISTQTFRFGVLIEHQSRLASKLAIEAGAFENGYDPYAAFGAFPEAHTSIVDGYENLVECVELVLRYSHYIADQAQRDAPLNPIDPFNDPDLERVFTAADIWNTLVEELGAVKFAGWRTHGGDDHACYSPGDVDEYIRYRVGQIREQAIQTQLTAGVLVRGHSDTLEALRNLATSIEVPARGATWNGRFSMAALRAAAMDPAFTDQAARWIDLRHYAPHANSISIPPRSLRWRTWFEALSALKVFSHALSIAVQPDLSSLPPDLGAAVLVADLGDLARVVEAAGLQPQDARDAINALTFSQQKRSLELWDQPLLPLADGRVLVVPGLIENGNPSRMLENAVSEWGEKRTGVRGIPFEKRIQDDITMRCPGTVQRNVVFYDGRSEPVQCDVVWWWAGHLFLIETKCLRSIHSYAEFARAKPDIEEALRQLRRRRLEVTKGWRGFRSHASDLDLPDLCPPSDRVVTIALTNILNFTCWETTDGIVADDFVFRRYFGDPRIEAWLVTPGEAKLFAPDLGRIRVDAPSPQGFLKYMRSPVQCSSVRDCIELDMISSISSHNDFPVWSFVGAYRPDLNAKGRGVVGNT